MVEACLPRRPGSISKLVVFIEISVARQEQQHYDTYQGTRLSRTLFYGRDSSVEKLLPKSIECAYGLQSITRATGGGGGEGFVCCLPWSFDHWPCIPFGTEHRSYSY